MKKMGIVLLALLLIVVIGWFAGPRPNFEAVHPEVPSFQLSADEVESLIQKWESEVDDLKADNAAHIYWADSSKAKTPWSIVFIHGFSASPKAGYPIIDDLAKAWGCNTYYSRIADHGRATKESFADLSPQAMVESTGKALAIGKNIGDKVLVVGSSTGCTLGAYYAYADPTSVDALMLYSPNIDMAAKGTGMMTGPWGLQLTRRMIGSDYRKIPGFDGELAQYWTTPYRVEGLVAVRALLDQTMADEGFAKIEQPLYMAYYYKNDSLMDKTISIEAANHFFNTVGTPENQKVKEVFPEIGAHVMLSHLQAKDFQNIRESATAFARDVLKMPGL
ncbi:MAG: alpha/beta hydrolase [Bacteroidota bacterium]